MRPICVRALGWLAACGTVPAWGINATDIKPVPGVILTNTVFASVITSSASFNYMDTESLFTLETDTPDGLTYQIRMSAPGNQEIEKVASRLKWPRKVRHEDLEESARMTLLCASTDPENYAGQTFAETSRKVLTTLKSGADVAFVIGTYSSLQGTAAPPPVAPAPRAGGAPPIPDMGQLFHMLFGSARRYYRGTLHRVEPQDVPVAVLVNGVRTNLPTVHAAGSFTFAQEDPVKVEMWWLDNPDWPLTLHWTFGPGSSLVTRIKVPVSGGGGLATQLAGKSCSVELHGVYFNSGSAVLLDESEPMLTEVAALIKASSEVLTIEGHTDNIGSAEYNQALSEHRASAVRGALVSRYGIAPGRLSARGFGLTRPVDTNATPVGRAHNRRVELSRPCAAH
jgi:outer membrane protein OmpA-like peptidoglycan-associated protein